MAASARVIAASVVGPGHSLSSLPCQDAVDWFVDDQHCHVAVADGLGSAEFSAEGSVVAVKAAIHMMTKCSVDSQDLSQVCFEAVTVARKAVLADCEAKGCEPR